MPMTRGRDRITSPWKPNSSTTVASRPKMDKGLIRDVKVPTAASATAALAARRAISIRVMTPAASGITTYRTTDRTSVSHGTVMSVTPSSRATIGA